VISLKGKEPTKLFMREFNVNLIVFTNRLAQMGCFLENPANITNIAPCIRKLFAEAGIDLDPNKGKSVFYHDRRGILLVRATMEELDRVEQLVVELNRPEPQIHIKVRFVEVERGETGSDWVLGTIGGQSNPPLARSATTSVTSNASPQSFTGILTDPQYRVVLGALEKRKDFSLLSEGEVTTFSGRQAQIQEVELRTILNASALPVSPLPGYTNTNTESTNLFQAQLVPFGPTLDVIPAISADGYTIQMTVIPTVTEFLGYEDPKKVLPPGGPPSNHETLPLPRMRVRQVTTSAVVWDGQTLVLGVSNDQLITKQPGGGIQKRENPDAPEKQLLVFITPTIVDPAGNRPSSPSKATKDGDSDSFQTPTNLRPIIDRPLY